MAILLVFFPMEASGRTLVIIKHENNAQWTNQSQRLSEDSRAISAAQRRKDEIAAQVDQARQDLLNAYTPSSRLYAPSRWDNIWQAQDELDNARSDY
jgi:hypothetical protein